MPDLMMVIDEIDQSPEDYELINKFFRPSVHLRIKIMRNTLSSKSDFSIGKTIVDDLIGTGSTEEITEFLYKGKKTINRTRYIRFLERIVEATFGFHQFISMPTLVGEGLQGISERSYEKALKYYFEIIHKPRQLNIVFPVQDLIKRMDDQTKTEIRLLASTYAEYLQAEEGKISKLCLEIESRREFKAIGLTNIKKEFERYEQYFKQLVKEKQLIGKPAVFERSGDYSEPPMAETTSLDQQFTPNSQLVITDDQKVKLISLCAKWIV